jgi:hypothetical protein
VNTRLNLSQKSDPLQGEPSRINARADRVAAKMDRTVL